jgi:hypothetical protein
MLLSSNFARRNRLVCRNCPANYARRPLAIRSWVFSTVKSVALIGRALGRGLLGPRNSCRAAAPALTAALWDGASEAPGIVAAQRLKRSRPLSRVLSWTVIPLAYASPRSSSDLPGSPCGPHVAAFKPLASLFGLAPGGVCRAVGVATRAVRSYRTISPLPAPLARHLGGIFLLHFP